MKHLIEIGGDGSIMLGVTVLTEEDTGGKQEISISFDRPDGSIIQDIALVRQSFKGAFGDLYTGEDVDNDNFSPETVDVFVYADETTEDYTHKFTIKAMNEGEN